MAEDTPTSQELNAGMVNRLRDIVQGGGDVDVSQFEFIGFDEIAQAYGSDWQAHQERVKETAQAFLNRRLGERDMLVRGADGFLIVFADRDTERSRNQAETLKDDLNTFYLGEGATQPPVQVAVNHRRLPVQELIQSLGDADFVEPSDPEQAGDGLDAISWKYQPVWDVQREAIFSYYVAPVLKQTGERVPGYQFDMDFNRNFNFVEIDEVSLNTSEATLRKMLTDGRRCQLGASIQSSSLVKVADRNRLFAIMDRFDRRMMAYRIIQVSATPPGFPRMYLEEFYQGLKRRVPKIAMSVAWNEGDIASIIKLRPHAIGFTLSPWALEFDDSISRDDLISKVRLAAGAVHAAKIPFYFDGYISPDLVAGLRRAGVDVISSPAIWEMQDAPKSAHHWPYARLAA